MSEHTGQRLDGYWQVVEYVTGGKPIPVIGSLLLADARWSVMYFVPQPDGSHWGSAEAGRYDYDDPHLTFHHELTFQGGGGREMVMSQASTVVERCTIALDAASLDISFPSGNIVRCRRNPRREPSF